MMPSSTRVTRQIGVEPPEAADLQLLFVVHAAGEEPSAAIALAVVQPRARLIGVHARDQIEPPAREIEEVEAVGERQHRAAAAAKRHRADVVVERPVPRPARARVQPPDRRVADAAAGAVQPVQAAVSTSHTGPSPRWFAHSSTHSIFSWPSPPSERPRGYSAGCSCLRGTRIRRAARGSSTWEPARSRASST